MKLTVEMLDNLTEAIGYRDIALIELNTTIQNNQSLENIDKENDWVFFNLGEIDCSGHLPQQAEKTSIDKAVEACVRKYVTYLALIKSQGYNVGVIGPHVAAWHAEEDSKVLKITKRFNEMLKFSGFKYVSILDELITNPSPDNYIDGYHLSPKVWPLFKEKFLKLQFIAILGHLSTPFCIES